MRESRDQFVWAQLVADLPIPISKQTAFGAVSVLCLGGKMLFCSAQELKRAGKGFLNQIILLVLSLLLWV